MSHKGTHKHPINKNLKPHEPPIMVSSWDFGPIHPQKERKVYTSDPFAARMRPPVARALVAIYGAPPVLDPMCGSGTTCVEAAYLGYESIGIDIEEKNIALCNQQIPQIRGASRLRDAQAPAIPLPTFIRADSRQIPFDDNHFGSIIFSPPYWNAIGHSHKRSIDKNDHIPPYMAERGTPTTWLTRYNPYGHTKGNIGNLNSYQSYLQEMVGILTECRRTLQPNRYCVLVVKDVRRNHRTVPLGADTINVGRDAGFRVFDVILNKMYFPAFWKIHWAIQRQQERGIPLSLTTHEYIIIFEKGEER